MGVWITCNDATCPFQTNSPKSGAKHTEESGHTVHEEQD